VVGALLGLGLGSTRGDTRAAQAAGTEAGAGAGAGAGGLRAPEGPPPVRRQHPVAQLRGVLSEELPRAYRLLESYTAQPEAMGEVKRILQGAEWVWVGDAFVAPQALAFDSPAHFPRTCTLSPAALRQFRRLLAALGVRETMGAEEYAVVLARMRADAGGQALPEDQLQFCLRVLEAVAELAVSQGRQPGDSPLLGAPCWSPTPTACSSPPVPSPSTNAAWLAGAMGAPAGRPGGSDGTGTHPGWCTPRVAGEMAEVFRGQVPAPAVPGGTRGATDTVPCLPGE